MVVGRRGRLSISFSLLAQAILHDHLPDTPWRSLIVSFGIGFMVWIWISTIVILLGAEKR